jgi:phosphomevalonate kinase
MNKLKLLTCPGKILMIGGYAVLFPGAKGIASIILLVKT